MTVMNKTNSGMVTTNTALLDAEPCILLFSSQHSNNNNNNNT